MNLDQFKSAWQADEILLPLAKEKEMKDIENLIETKVTSVIMQQRRYFLGSMVRMLILPIIIFVGFYVMSSGFTNPNDPIGTLWVLLALPFGLFFFFGQRYLATVALTHAMTQSTRETLPKVTQFLHQNKLAEIGLLALFGFILIGGIINLILAGNLMASLPMVVFALLLLGGVTTKVWFNYQSKQQAVAELLQQLDAE